MRLVILPQALRTLLPPLTSQYLNIIKSTTLGAAIAYPEILQIFARTVLNQSGRAVEVMTLVLGVFLAINLPCPAAMNRWDRRLQGAGTMRLLARALFGTPANAAADAADAGLLAWALPPLWHWAFAAATWTAPNRRGCAPRRRVLGLHPGAAAGCSSTAAIRRTSAGGWTRGRAAAGALLGSLFARRGAWLALLLVGVPVASGVLLAGGVFGLTPVADRRTGAG